MNRQRDFNGTGSQPLKAFSRAVIIQCELWEPLAIPCPQEAFVLGLALGFFGFYWGRNSVRQAPLLLELHPCYTEHREPGTASSS